MGHSGGGGSHSGADGAARCVGGVPAAGDGGIRPFRAGGGAGLRAFDRGLWGGVRPGRLFAGQKRPPLRRAVGDRAAVRRVLCGGGPARRGGRLVLGGVQCSGRAGHGLFVPLHPVLRPKVVRGPQGAGHRGHRGRGGAFGGFSDGFCPHCSERLWPGAGHPGGFLGPGGVDAARLSGGQRPADRPAARKAAAGAAGERQGRAKARPCTHADAAHQAILALCRGGVLPPLRRCCCSAPSS